MGETSLYDFTRRLKRFVLKYDASQKTIYLNNYQKYISFLK
ncbi:hypothetical protein P262_04439 [Cronobacter malonaticus]|uniref:Uncharacterized protein n=1 Tax=Cronobacter malonaticus TaxID=413503 RepID=V5U308_9ENTR|nr:hypothetical protein P262_04439 [Cronobacter malonaticus]CCJ95487.1 hypothetical protein BN131_3160 [Cronobacter malonaticus 681]CCJ96990.1 hypothetical protein BN130_3112 [Cronobacter malonaticus 507]